MKYNKIKIGECMSESQHYIVKDIAPNSLTLKPDSGDEITVDRGYAETFLTSGEQFSSEQTINKTEAAALFVANPYVALTVCYNKMVKAADVKKEILAAYETSTPKEFSLALDNALKSGLSGEVRVMQGFHYGKMDELGRILFIDMKLERDLRRDYDTRQRLVDPRTINYIILRDVKYNVK